MTSAQRSTDASNDQLYDADFYKQQKDRSKRSSRVVVPRLVEALGPASWLDVGCGVGTWLSTVLECGVSDVAGVDGSYVDRSQLFIPQDLFNEADLRKGFDLGRRFDVVSTLEVIEHLPIEASPAFVRSLCAHGDLILFSGAAPLQGGVDHIAERWPAYWVEAFDKLGYAVMDVIRPAFWEQEDVAWYYRQNMLLFVNKQRTDLIQAVSAAFPGWSINYAPPLVHPDGWLARNEDSAISGRRALKIIGARTLKKFGL